MESKITAADASEAAVEKMRNGDFYSAREIALEAQKLFLAVESFEEIILVCNIHCSAAEGKDWYKILGVDPAAHEAAVKKQCGRMALVLHPDRNKLPGAAEAFQLIMEAKAVLVDCEKRRVYDDSTCRTNQMAVGEQWGFGFSRYGNDDGSIKGFARFRNGEAESIGFSRFGDSREQQHVVINEFGNWPDGGGSRGLKMYQPNSVVQNTVSDHDEVEISDFGFSRFLNSKHSGEGPNWDNGFSRLQNGGGVFENCPNGSRGGGGGGGRGRGGRGRGRGRGSKFNEPGSNKQNIVASQDGLQNYEWTNLENGVQIQPKRPRGRPRGSGCGGSGTGRGRGRGRGSSKNVPDLGDEGGIACAAPKKSKRTGETQEDDQNYKRAIPSVPVITPDSEILEYTDAEFNDFEKGRSRTCFEAGQIWAVYDTLDAMPRFYAMINSLLEDHKLQITWLEPLPNGNDEKEWLYRGLPACFGKFKTGYTEMIQDHAIFSHLVKWKRDAVMKKNYNIHPQKGETWAVFKNWDIKWDCNSQRIGGFQYEVVEILSDYFDDFGVNVTYLGKVEGFSYIFGRKVGKGVDWEVIKVKDRLKFSHRIPSFTVNIEGPNGLESFFELDPASLPRSFGSLCP